MEVATRPELERFVDEQMQAGRCPSATAVIAAALADMMAGRYANPLDAEDRAAIAAADAEFDRGGRIEPEAGKAELAKW